MLKSMGSLLLAVTAWTHVLANGTTPSDSPNCAQPLSNMCGMSSCLCSRYYPCHMPEKRPDLITTPHAFLTPFSTATECIHAMSNELLVAIIKDISKSWSNIVIFSDALPVSRLETHVTHQSVSLVYGCNTADVTNHSLIYTNINDVVPRGDYVNVVIDCPSNRTLVLIKQVTDRTTMEHRYNWLLATSDWNTFEAAQYLVRDSDNMVMARLTLGKIDDPLQFTADIVSFDLYWCFFNCYRLVTPSHVGSVTYPQIFTGSRLGLDKLLPDKFSHFHGAHLVVAFELYNPFCFPTNENEKGSYTKDTLTGIEPDMLDVMSHTLNFSYEFMRTEDNQWGNKLPNGSFTGMVGMVHRKVADLAVCGISMSSARAEVIDYLYPHWYVPSVMVLKLQYDKTRYFIQPLNFGMWLIVGISPIVVAVTVQILEMLSASIKHPQSRGSKLFDANCSFLVSYSILLAQGVNLRKKSWPSLVILGSFWMVCVVLFGVYTGNLTASLAVPKGKMPFETLEEFATDREYDLIVERGTFHQLLIETADTPLMKMLKEKVATQGPHTYQPATDDNVRYVAENDKYVYTMDETRFLGAMRNCDICEEVTIMNDVYLESGMGVVLRQNMPHKKTMDRFINGIQQNGLMTHWRRKYVYEVPTIGAELAPVNLEDVSLLCTVIFGYGLAVALSVLLMEINFHAMKTKYWKVISRARRGLLYHLERMFVQIMEAQ